MTANRPHDLDFTRPGIPFAIMRVALFAAAGFLSLPVWGDEALAKTKGCMACHAAERKLIGPTYRDMAGKYAGRKDAETLLAENTLKGTPAPGGLGWRNEGKASLSFMPSTPGLRPEEARRLSRWILTHKR
ncbi:MAG: c-type cytochrome [Candidatus Accumulibacter sp.]|jgi:cytochrome c|nr:c-type cytochrome [Accumulibacter sp.]